MLRVFSITYRPIMCTLESVHNREVQTKLMNVDLLWANRLIVNPARVEVKNWVLFLSWTIGMLNPEAAADW